MRIIVHDDKKIVEIWLTNSEQNDSIIGEKLKPLYHSCKQKKYTVAVYQSGSRSLYNDMRYLAQQHRKRMAENDLRREKQENACTRGFVARQNLPCE